MAVSFYLKKAVGHGDEEEAIHQLRVWTRRSATALDLFAAGLPGSPREKMLKTLHKLRRAAGEVRDCDLQLKRIKQFSTRFPKYAKKAVKRERRQAFRKLKKLRHRLRHQDRFSLEIEQLLEKIAWPKRSKRRRTPAYGILCRRHLAMLSRQFLRQAKANLHDFSRLHQLRKHGKSWRYALELAASVIPASPLQQLYQFLDDVQDRFGLICDQQALLSSLDDWLGEIRSTRRKPKLVALINVERNKQNQAYKKLLHWWSPARLRQLRKLASAAS